jgi:ribosome-binding protein aMBF1 (putative translation factor)
MGTNTCPVCGSANLQKINVTGYTDLVCGDCGHTVQRDIYHSKDYENRKPIADLPPLAREEPEANEK